MLFKHKENGLTIEFADPSLFILAERNGFEKVKEEKPKEIKK